MKDYSGRNISNTFENFNISNVKMRLKIPPQKRNFLMGKAI